MAKNYLFNFFSGSNNRRNLGYTKEDAAKHTPFGVCHFFSALWNNLSKLTIANLLFVLTNITVICFLVAFPFMTTVNMPSNVMYPVYYGMHLCDDNPVVSALLTANSGVIPTSAHNTTTIILFCIGALSILTFGASCVGLTAVCRNAARGDCNFVWSTYWDAVKKNWKQATVFGVADLGLMFLLVYDVIAYNANAGNGTFFVFLYIFSIFLAFLYFVMRFYIYLQILTFDLKIKQILKNALYFVTLNFKRNIIALIATVAVLLLEYYLFISGAFVSISFVIPIIILFSLLTYISAFCAWPSVKLHIADAYYRDHPEENPEKPSEDSPVFTDRG